VVPESKRNEALSFIKGGLRDISITRTSIDWGVTVPWDDEHVFYVWYDALINYVTAIGYGEDEQRFEEWWPAVHHLIGKEIIRFHCVWWPAMCMAAGIDPPAHVQVHGWLLVGGEKMSKSSVNQITPGELTAEYGVDPIRYHLLRDTPLGSDGDFSSRRDHQPLQRRPGQQPRQPAVPGGHRGRIQVRGGRPRPGARQPPGRCGHGRAGEATEAWNAGQPHLALEATWRLIRETNAELEVAEPWKADPGPGVDATLGSALEVLRIVSILIVPAMPATAGRSGLGSGSRGRPPTSACRRQDPGAATPGGQVTKGVPLFPRRKA
jgi:methionyl-tRNA synthetase